MPKSANLLEANAEKLGKLEGIYMIGYLVPSTEAAGIRNIKFKRMLSTRRNLKGQPVTLAEGFVTVASAISRYYTGLAGKVAGESYPPEGDGSYKIVAYEPLGVCTSISA